MADRVAGGCLFTVRTINLMKKPVDEACSTTVEQMIILKRGLFEMHHNIASQTPLQPPPTRPITGPASLPNTA